jgi:hypothetical protein
MFEVFLLHFPEVTLQAFFISTTSKLLHSTKRKSKRKSKRTSKHKSKPKSKHKSKHKSRHKSKHKSKHKSSHTSKHTSSHKSKHTSYHTSNHTSNHTFLGANEIGGNAPKDAFASDESLAFLLKNAPDETYSSQ